MLTITYYPIHVYYTLANVDITFWKRYHKEEQTLNILELLFVLKTNLESIQTFIFKQSNYHDGTNALL